MRKITVNLIVLLIATLPLMADIQMAPDGSYVDGQPQMAPDGSYLGSGNIEMAPDGSYIAVEPDPEDVYFTFDYQEPEELGDE